MGNCDVTNCDRPKDCFFTFIMALVGLRTMYETLPKKVLQQINLKQITTCFLYYSVDLIINIEQSCITLHRTFYNVNKWSIAVAEAYNEITICLFKR